MHILPYSSFSLSSFVLFYLIHVAYYYPLLGNAKASCWSLDFNVVRSIYSSVELALWYKAYSKRFAICGNFSTQSSVAFGLCAFNRTTI